MKLHVIFVGATYKESTDKPLNRNSFGAPKVLSIIATQIEWTPGIARQQGL
jgi:hypothetical protein